VSDVAAVSGRSGEVAAARLLLDRMGLSPADLIAADGDRPAAPKFGFTLRVPTISPRSDAALCPRRQIVS
jgi:hypothetical protein